MKRILDILGGVAAFLTITVFILLMIDSNWAFLPTTLGNILRVVQVWAPLGVTAVAGLEFVSEKPFLIKLVYYIMVAALVVFLFFPGTWTNFVGIVNGAVKK